MSVGDWIRFMHSGRLVIDEIAYLIPRASWDSTIEAMTVSHGRVRLDDVLERRQQAQPCAGATCGDRPPTPPSSGSGSSAAS